MLTKKSSPQQLLVEDTHKDSPPYSLVLSEYGRSFRETQERAERDIRPETAALTGGPSRRELREIDCYTSARDSCFDGRSFRETQERAERDRLLHFGPRQLL